MKGHQHKPAQPRDNLLPHLGCREWQTAEKKIIHFAKSRIGQIDTALLVCDKRAPSASGGLSEKSVRLCAGMSFRCLSTEQVKACCHLPRAYKSV